MNTKHLFCSLAFCFAVTITTAQEIVNIVMVGDKGVTEDIKEATSFIAVKLYPGNIFERLDYKVAGPLIKLRTYSDSNLTILQGKYIEYDENGNMYLDGEYHNNKKHGDWRYYNDTGKVLLTRVYEYDSLIKSEEPKIEENKKMELLPGEEEASFGSGKNDWSNYITKTLNPDVSFNIKTKGRIKVSFIVDTSGKTTHIYLRRSALFILDEEGLRIIRNSPLWNPAFQKGRKVKAYRIQPLTFMPPE